MIAVLGIGAGLIFSALPAEAAHLSVSSQGSSAKVEKKTTEVASKEPEETGSIQTGTANTGTCDRSRKRLFVEGEGWIVRKVTTCY